LPQLAYFLLELFIMPGHAEIPSAVGAAFVFPAAQFDGQLLARLGKSGPRYTSYPTADRFIEAFDAAAYASAMRSREIGALRQPLSLYVHLPFCNTVCFYCACNKVVTGNRSRSSKYLQYLEKEVRLQSALLGSDRHVTHMHWGGGTPTFLAHEELSALMAMLRRNFDFDPRGEYAIEIDPRDCGEGTFPLLAGLGFNRASFGVQDFAPEVYGLPKQTVASFGRTLAQVLAIAPDRIALYSYAHLPARFKPQRRILDADLPAAGEKLDILARAVEAFQGAGYVYIGMDHFARVGDELERAQRQGRLTRNFQGYSSGPNGDLVGLGVSAIGKIGATYSQNVRDLPAYYDLLDQGKLPVARGLKLTADDVLRRAVIHAILCQFELSYEAIEAGHLVGFRRYFAAELAQLEEFAALGLVTLEEDGLAVTPRGRFVVRAIACLFDRHLRSDKATRAYSRII